ncbi:unnamed protein product [Eruca vesicaria subsp. sativa]|uniref:Uncharacterized protein n=1 Tax=Eruca vesicaria subsp. sativa TaxID=29727 RepID=A0ABC8L2G0_ERUVS|nr:unnamed protein product [Eruca vesicaria subsp. sativa]
MWWFATSETIHNADCCSLQVRDYSLHLLLQSDNGMCTIRISVTCFVLIIVNRHLYYNVDNLNSVVLNPLLQDLVTTPFFRYFKNEFPEPFKRPYNIAGLPSDNQEGKPQAAVDRTIDNIAFRGWVESNNPWTHDSDLEWKLVYIGSAEDETYDQTLESVFVGPVNVGNYHFVLQAGPPDPSKIREKDIIGVTYPLNHPF